MQIHKMDVLVILPTLNRVAAWLIYRNFYNLCGWRVPDGHKSRRRFFHRQAALFTLTPAPFACELLKTRLFHHQRIISALYCRNLVVMPWVLIAFHRMKITM